MYKNACGPKYAMKIATPIIKNPVSACFQSKSLMRLVLIETIRQKAACKAKKRDCKNLVFIRLFIFRTSYKKCEKCSCKQHGDNVLYCNERVECIEQWNVGGNEQKEKDVYVGHRKC